jgi:hypothetical protein
MDDPWGSPWATTDSPPKPTSRADVPAPPSVLLSAPPPTLSFTGSQSPWADDDAFGEWKVAEPVQSSAWGVWGADGQPSRPASSRKESVAAWPRSTSPAQNTLVPSPSANTPRHHSPDPWANDRYDRQSSSKPVSPLPSLHSVLPLPALPSHGDLVLDHQEVNQHQADSIPSKNIRITEPRARESIDDTSRKASGIDGNDRDGWQYETTLDSAVSTNERIPNAAHSASSSDSGFDEPEGNSRATSSRDESIGNAPSQSQTEASKVRKLVDMYDGLSRKDEVQPELDGTPKEHHGGVDTVNTDSRHDYKADENGNELVNEPTPSPKSPPRTDVGALPGIRESPNEDEANQAAKTNSNIAYSVDLSILKDLFPGTGDIEPCDSADVADHIIHDSFTSISERKLWYRISRLGSSRKHDSGQDENYVRVNWQSSELKEQVIKVVRRWMEEDSIAGRTTMGSGLGRGSSSHMFGWDSTAAPVELDKVFGRKISHVPTSSMPQSPLAPRHSSGIANSRLGTLSPTADATFSWSSGPLPAQSEAVAALPDGSLKESTRVSTSGQTIALRPTPPVKFAPVIVGSQMSRLETGGKDQEDDDEWGEMVSSPQKTQTVTWDMTWNSARKPSVGATSLPLHAQGGPRGGLASAQTASNRLLTNLPAPNSDNLIPQINAPISPTLDTRPRAKTPRPEPTALTKAADSRSIIGVDETAANIQIVQKLVRELPDLSYMLR